MPGHSKAAKYDTRKTPGSARTWVWQWLIKGITLMGMAKEKKEKKKKKKKKKKEEEEEEEEEKERKEERKERKKERKKEWKKVRSASSHCHGQITCVLLFRNISNGLETLVKEQHLQDMQKTWSSESRIKAWKALKLGNLGQQKIIMLRDDPRMLGTCWKGTGWYK